MSIDIRECKATGAILLVAKLDRLSRNLHFVTALQNSKVDFVAAVNPHATPFLIHILVAVAEHERNLISSRTKAALQAAKRRGKKLGNPRYLTLPCRQLGLPVVRSQFRSPGSVSAAGPIFIRKEHRLATGDGSPQTPNNERPGNESVQTTENTPKDPHSGPVPTRAGTRTEK